MATNHNGETWPERPGQWPDVLDEIELAQLLRLDGPGRSVASAKRTLRRLRRLHALPSVGRVAGRVLTRRESVESWLRGRERRHDQGMPEPTVGDEARENKGPASGNVSRTSENACSGKPRAIA